MPARAVRDEGVVLVVALQVLALCSGQAVLTLAAARVRFLTRHRSVCPGAVQEWNRVDTRNSS